MLAARSYKPVVVPFCHFSLAYVNRGECNGCSAGQQKLSYLAAPGEGVFSEGGVGEERKVGNVAKKGAGRMVVF